MFSLVECLEVDGAPTISLKPLKGRSVQGHCILTPEHGVVFSAHETAQEFRRFPFPQVTVPASDGCTYRARNVDISHHRSPFAFLFLAFRELREVYDGNSTFKAWSGPCLTGPQGSCYATAQ